MLTKLLSLGPFSWRPILHRFLNVKALVGAFNQEKALVPSWGLFRDCLCEGSLLLDLIFNVLTVKLCYNVLRCVVFVVKAGG